MTSIHIPLPIYCGKKRQGKSKVLRLVCVLGGKHKVRNLCPQPVVFIPQAYLAEYMYMSKLLNKCEVLLRVMY